MAIKTMKTSDLVQLAAAGGGFTISAQGRPVSDLVTIAAAASNKGARLTITGVAGRMVAELVQIAAAGKGCVVFED